MRTIAINPVKRRRANMAGKKKTKSKAPAQRSNPVKKAPSRNRKRNPKAGLSQQEMRNLGTSAIGGAAAGALTSYLDDNKPDFLEKVPTEIVAIAAGVGLAMFGKTPALKNLSRGVVAYGAGRMTERFMADQAAAPAAAPPQTAALMYSNPQYNPGHYNDEIHVGGLVFSLED